MVDEEIKQKQITQTDLDAEIAWRALLIKDIQKKSRAIDILLPLVKQEDIIDCLAKLSKLQQEKREKLFEDTIKKAVKV